MSTSVPPRDGGSLSGTNDSTASYLNDESALKRLFDAQYERLLTTARTQLGDAASQAPRVVESAFVSAWTARATMSTAAQVDAFLAQEVQHGSSRTLSRRAAAARFGNKGGGRDSGSASRGAAAESATPADSWNRITAVIHQSSHSADAHAAAANVTRHEAASHMKKVGRGTSWMPYLVIGVIALIASVAAVIYTSRLGEDDAIYSEVNSPGIQPVESSAGQIGTTTLADGTKMRMGPQTRYMKPDGFPDKVRAIKVEGTAQFDVAPGQKEPFRVVAKHFQMIATGTSFAVSSYPSDSGVMVSVKEGTVTIKGTKQPTTVTANQALLIDSGTTRALTADERNEAFGWVDGRVILANKPLSAAVATLLRWYDVDVKVPDTSLLSRTVSFNASSDSSDDAIKQIETSGHVKFGYEGDNKLFTDAPATPAKPAKAAAAAKSKKKKK